MKYLKDEIMYKTKCNIFPSLVYFTWAKALMGWLYPYDPSAKADGNPVLSTVDCQLLTAD